MSLWVFDMRWAFKAYFDLAAVTALAVAIWPSLLAANRRPVGQAFLPALLALRPTPLIELAGPPSLRKY